METLKSFILSVALIDNHLTVETAVHLSRLELEFQVVYCFLKMDFTLSARVCGPLPKTLSLFMTKIFDIPYPIYDLTKNSKPYL